MKTNIAIFASGSGSNAENIIKYFKNSDLVEISMVVCDNPDAYVLERCKSLSVPSILIKGSEFKNSDSLLTILCQYRIDAIVLAGFLRLIPPYLLTAYPKKIINIHPALLPKYGGKGMYGHFVHEAVIANQEKESGITIHYVNERYDEGQIIFQAQCIVSPIDTPDDVADKIHFLEMEHFPRVIEEWTESVQRH